MLSFFVFYFILMFFQMLLDIYKLCKFLCELIEDSFSLLFLVVMDIKSSLLVKCR